MQLFRNIFEKTATYAQHGIFSEDGKSKACVTIKKKNHSYKNTVQPDRIQSVIHYFHPQDLLLSACIFQAVPVSFQHCLLPVKCSIHEEEIGHTQKKGMEEKI